MKVKISIPTDLSEIKLSQYQKYLAILKDNDESDFIIHKLLQIFYNIDLNVVSAMRQKDIEEASKTINELFVKVPSLITKFKLNNIEYGFIPNLEDITSGEYMDLDTYFTESNEWHRAMSVLYRPITQRLNNKYLIEPYEGTEKYAEIMKEVPLNVVLSAMVFFWSLGNELLLSTMDYLVENPLLQQAIKQNSGSVGDGIQASMLSLKEMLEDSMKLPNYQLINA